MENLMDLVTGLRSARTEMNIEPRKALDVTLVVTDSEVRVVLQKNLDKVKLLARLGAVEFVSALPAQHVQLKGVWKYGEFGLNLEGAVDFKAERERLSKELNKVRDEIQKIVKKLNSHEFTDRAPEEVVTENRTRHAELVARLERLEVNLNRLPAN